jgi:hypothetical protein
MYVSTGPANFLGERTPCKKWLISNPDKIKEQFFQGSIKPPFTSQNRGEIR